MVSAPGPKDRGSERAVAGAKEEGKSRRELTPFSGLIKKGDKNGG